MPTTNKNLIYLLQTVLAIQLTIGLLKPVERKGKQLFKFYDDVSLERLDKIRIFREAGLSIDTIIKIIDNSNPKYIRCRLMEKLKVKELNLKTSMEETKNLKQLISKYDENKT